MITDSNKTILEHLRAGFVIQVVDDALDMCGLVLQQSDSPYGPWRKCEKITKRYVRAAMARRKRG